MDKRQKSTLRGHHIKLANDLILDEDFYAQLRQHKIFTEGMISIIKDVQKPRDQVFKMLELLEKRGPKAFDNFVWILKENYDWLADMLEESYQEKLQGNSDSTGSASRYGEEQTRLKNVTTEEEISRFPKLCRPNSIPAAASRPSKKNSQTSSQGPISATVNMNGKNDQFFSENFKIPTRNLNSEDDSDEDIDETDARLNCRGQESKSVGEARLESGKTVKSQATKFADACISPIQTVESPRKTTNATCSPIPSQRYSVNSNYSPLKLPNIPQEGSNEETDFNDRQGDEIIEDDPDNDSDLLSEANETENEDEVDEFDNAAENEIIQTDEDIESSEVFYDTIRRQSQIEDEESELRASRLGRQNSSESNEGMNATLSDTINTNETSILEYNSYQPDESEIKEIYLRLLTLTKKCKGEMELTVKQINEIDEMGLTFEMIHEQIDEIAQVLEKSVENTMLKKCYDFFDEKDKKMPLHKLIEKLKEEKTEYSSKYFDEVKKTNEMANDMYEHSQEMKMLDKLKGRLHALERENNDLKGKYITLEGINGQQRKKIEELEIFKSTYGDTKMDEKRHMASKGRDKRKSSYGGTSPRKPTGLYTEPRLAVHYGATHGMFPSARSRNPTTGTSSWKTYTKKQP